MSAYGMFFPRMILSVLLALMSFPAVLTVDRAHAQALGQVVITNSYANIRSGPGTNFSQLGRANRGESFPLNETRRDWHRITYRGRDAWVFSRLVRVESGGPSTAEVEHLRSQIESLDSRVERITDRMTRLQQALLDRFEQNAPSRPRQQSQSSINIPEPDIRSGPRRVGPAWAMVPGAPRIRVGHPVRGWSLLGATGGCAAAGAWAYLDYRDRRDEYRALTETAPQSEFDRLHRRAEQRQNLARGLLYGAAGLYALNVADYFLFLPKPRVEWHSSGNSARIDLSFSCDF